ncbi:MAG: M48 family metalloprotease [Planctomycetaceae bacterium]|jgi:Zn-dependent protease with chaperone function/uncharacterized tellurite resistance protein B-like protein|nr:M48 family metalloprotease [Planctomycetaceae bacterium]
MHFFDQQSRAKKQTVLLFGLYLVIMSGMIYLSYSLVQAFLMRHNGTIPQEEILFFLLCSPADFRWSPNFTLLASIAITVVTLVSLTALMTVRRLHGGNAKVAMSLDGSRIVPYFAGKYERRFYNTVCEMAVASGLRVPEVFLMKHEKGINAFTLGGRRGGTVLCITQGMLDQLSREELQGVVAHEFSHILHGDTQFNLQISGLLSGSFVLTAVSWTMFGILAGAVIAPMFLGRLGVMLFLIPGLLYEYGLFDIVYGIAFGLATICFLNLLFVTYVKRAILRQREYLADASSVQWTRYPQGIIGALQKIEKAQFGSRIFHSRVSLISHITFASVQRGNTFLSRFLDTHPPVRSRILAIESRKEFWPEEPVKGFDAPKVKVQPEISAQPLKFAVNLFESIPAEIQKTASDPNMAAPLLYALFLNREPDIRQKQLHLILQFTDAPTLNEVRKIAGPIASLGEEYKTPVSEIAFPTLRKLSLKQYETFRKTVHAMIRADGQMDLFEYTFLAHLTRELDWMFGVSERDRVKHYSCEAVAKPFFTVLSRLAYAGADQKEMIFKAYNEGCHIWGTRQPILPLANCGFTKFDASLKELAASSPVKKRIIRALTACIMADEVVTDRERKLLRAVAAMIGVPMPILV